MASNGESPFRLLAVAPRTRELTGAVDLVSHYHLREQYEAFCKKPLPNALSDSSYLSNVVGDSELRRGEGMELGHLVQGPSGSSMPSSDRAPFQPFDLDVLRKAFTLKEAGPISLPESEKGLPTVSGKGKDQNEEKKRKKHKHRSKERDKERDKEKEKKKDRDKDKKRDKEKDRDRSKGENGEKKHKKKKRRHEGEDGEDGHRHKSKKHKQSSKVEGRTVLIKNGK